MTTEYKWQESYAAALLETDWTKIRMRIQAAEFAIQERLFVLSQDHGGTLEERQAIGDALLGLRFLRKEVGQWDERQAAS